MTNCNETMARLQTFLDRELTDAEIAEVQMHLEACPPCLGYFSFERRIRRLVRIKACTDKAPPGLRETIIRRCSEIENETAGRN